MITWIFHYLYTLVVTLINSLKSNPTIYDGIKVILAGASFEASRRLSRYLTDVITESLTLKARIGDNDEAFDWLHHYLSTHVPIQSDNSFLAKIDPYALRTILIDSIWPSGVAAPRDVQIATRKPRGRWWYGWSSDSGKWGEDVLGSGKDRVKVSIVPTIGKTQLIKFQGVIIKMGMVKSDHWAFDSEKWFVMSTFLGTHQTFTNLLNHAHQQYQALSSGSTAIYSPKGRDEPGWYRSNTRPSRPWDSVILPGDTKEELLRDMQEFLKEREFYKQRGLPWRRGYLFYGVPGSGKSSFIAALASKLQFDIYSINLGGKSVDDDKLHGLLQACPSNCILLMEDIDCAFTKRKHKNRKNPIESSSSSSSSTESSSDIDTDSSDSSDAPKKKKSKKNKHKVKPMFSFDRGYGSGLTLSGLLNALDGVGSSEGRILFCTTNWVDKIDPALSRPGRCDVWIEFCNATKDQAKDVFLQFYRTFEIVQENTPTSTESSTQIEKVSKHITTTHEKENSSRVMKADLTESPPPGYDISVLADRFAEAIPDCEVSVSAIQGYLMRFKRKPQEAADNAAMWVEDGCGKGPTLTFSKTGKELRQMNEKNDKPTEDIEMKNAGNNEKHHRKQKKSKKDRTKTDKKIKKKKRDENKGKNQLADCAEASDEKDKTTSVTTKTDDSELVANQSDDLDVGNRESEHKDT
ncbi:uncharacterized protein I206_105189 [Kwoniella pini CBS 10737]|uniref:AAA+ ATPase domain-containing protein n=1 Tax=Kwoniella pini CBS 10737 TaxID=1296096 RepID=A0A1B9I4X7_9TREE|nr:uncharacterized protein I206_03902 [Kwoniella pini CBS 10737]OCF50577.1 hypothetical protein I206_03902 [Kwoniella pini CBS 10737]